MITFILGILVGILITIALLFIYCAIRLNSGDKE